jgi:hypothetical protein
MSVLNFRKGNSNNKIMFSKKQQFQLFRPKATENYCLIFQVPVKCCITASQTQSAQLKKTFICFYRQLVNKKKQAMARSIKNKI